MIRGGMFVFVRLRRVCPTVPQFPLDSKPIPVPDHFSESVDALVHTVFAEIPTDRTVGTHK
jgi:hypothetical protein